MKTAAIINAFNIIGTREKALFSDIRARTGVDQVVAVMNGDFLSYPVNLLTVELAKSLKKFYSSITPVFYFMAEGPQQEILPDPGSGNRIARDDALGALIMEKLYEMSPKDSENKLNDIYGGYEADTKRILSCLPENGGTLSFRKFSQDISTRKKTEEDMRCYLLRFLLDFRGMDNSIYTGR